MSFWNNPEKNSIKVLLLVLVVAAAGFFIFNSRESASLGDSGRVINTINNQRVKGGAPINAQEKCNVFASGGGAGSACTVLTSSCTLDQGTVQNGCCQTKTACVPLVGSIVSNTSTKNIGTTGQPHSVTQ